MTFNGSTFDGPAYTANGIYGPPVSIASILDGTSNTAIFSESVKGKASTQDGPWMVYVAGTSFNAATPIPALGISLQTTLQTYGATCTSTTQSKWSTKGSAWANQTPGIGGGYSHLMAPNKMACFFSNYNASPPTLAIATMIGASSYHPGGVNVGMCDGSVKFIKDSTSLQTWGSLATKAGGEVIDASSY